MEAENRQLQVVIAQLRQVRKTNKGEEENLLGERDELRVQNAAQLSEIARLEKAVAVNAGSAEQVGKLRAELSGALNRALFLEQALDETKRLLAALEITSYQKQSQLDICTSDLLLLRQDLELRSTEVRNLMEALSQVQREKTTEVLRAQDELEGRTEQLRRELEVRFQLAEAEWQAKMDAADQGRLEAVQRSEDEQLFRRKAEMDFQQEKRKVQATLESALQQLNNSQQDVVDRTLIANLLVSYFKRRRSLEVMELIAKVLAFGDEQKVAVGLKVAPTNLISSLFASVIGSGSAASAPQEVEVRHPSVTSPHARVLCYVYCSVLWCAQGDNLAEQWINFLITQAEDGGKDKQSK